jgi:hypothetical protein
MGEEGEVPETPVEGEVSVDKLVKIYVKIRDKRTALKGAFEAEDGGLEAQLDTIKEAILEICRKTGSEAIRTAHGTATRSVKTRYWTQDWSSMHEFIKENDALHLLEKRISQTAMKDFLENNPDKHPPGLSADSKYDITVRRSK